MSTTPNTTRMARSSPMPDVGKDLERSDGEQLGDDAGRVAVLAVRPREEDGEDAERRHEPRDRRGPSQRTHHQEVDGTTQDRSEAERQEPGDHVAVPDSRSV